MGHASRVRDSPHAPLGNAVKRFRRGKQVGRSKFAQYSHEVRLLSPQFVKPFVKTNKTDRADAEAICEAMQRPTMRFVPMKECRAARLANAPSRTCPSGETPYGVGGLDASLVSVGFVIPPSPSCSPACLQRPSQIGGQQ